MLHHLFFLCTCLRKTALLGQNKHCTKTMIHPVQSYLDSSVIWEFVATKLFWHSFTLQGFPLGLIWFNLSSRNIAHTGEHIYTYMTIFMTLPWYCLFRYRIWKCNVLRREWYKCTQAIIRLIVVLKNDKSVSYVFFLECAPD